MAVKLRKYYAATFALYILLMLLTTNSGGVSSTSPGIQAGSDFESICRGQVSQEIARHKGAATRRKDMRLMFMIAYSTALTAGAIAISGPVGFYVLAIYGGISMVAIHQEHDSAIRALEAEEDHRRAQCSAEVR